MKRIEFLRERSNADSFSPISRPPVNRVYARHPQHCHICSNPFILGSPKPIEVFEQAGSAVKKGDWHGLFKLLDRKDVVRIAAHPLSVYYRENGAALTRLAEQFGFPVEVIASIQALDRRIMSSANEIGWPSPGSIGRSKEHRGIVLEREKIIKNALNSVSDLPAFAGALEAYRRETTGGGTVSSSLFVEESLRDIVVESDRAWATRVNSRGVIIGDIGFQKIAGQWYIRLFARKPASKTRMP